MIDLPTSPAPAAVEPGLIDFGAVLKPPFGAKVQRIDRQGNRFRIGISMPPMKNPKVGRIWLSRLLQGKVEGARIAFPLQGFDPGIPGAVLVDGPDAAGSTLPVTGATANYAFREGQFFSIFTASRHYLHFVRTETIADASGNAVLPIYPMLRRQPADGDPCHFGKPMIEGLIYGDEQRWQGSIGNFIGLSFEIEEVE